MLLVTWLLLGLIGVLLSRWSYASEFNEDFWCFSPFMYIVFLFCTILGGFIIIAGISAAVSMPSVQLTKMWFFRPICKQKKG